MQNNLFIENICTKIKNGDIVSPFLFLNKKGDLLNSQVIEICTSILDNLNVPLTYLFRLEDDWEKIKIDALKCFLEKWNLKSSFDCQIFLIENIWRFTLSSANTCLKFFEEPWKWNIIILTNPSESQVLDTILSRVIQINTSNVSFINKKNDFYFSLIHKFIVDSDYSLYSYFFNEKLEKSDYILFLENIILYSKEYWKFTNLLFSIEKDINNIKNNNVSPKFIIDKTLIELNLEK